MTVCWNYVPLGEIAPARSSSLPSAETTAWNLSLEDIEATTGKILRKQECRVSDLGSSKCSFDARHVLYSKLRPYLSKVVLPDAPGVGTSELIPLLPDADRLDREFLALYLRSKNFLDFANANTRGANLPRIAMAELWAHKVPVPPRLAEQRRIVARVKECMERIEEIEVLRSSAYVEAQAVLPSVLNQVFKTLNGITAILTIGDVSLETRYGTSQKCHSEAVGTPILRIPNVAGGSINYDNLKYCDLGEGELKRIELEPGDLLFVRTNGSRDLVGRCAVFDIGQDHPTFGFASYLIRVRVDQRRVLPRYLAYFLNSTNGRHELNQRRRTSAGQFNINSENLRSIPFPVPSIADQERLLGVLQEREAHATQLVKELVVSMSDGRFMRDAILHKAFAGGL